MTTTASHPRETHGLRRALHRARSEPAYGAFLTLWAGFTVLPLVMGLDKFANVLADWEGYLALGRQPAAVQRPHGHAHRGRDRGRRGGPRGSPALLRGIRGRTLARRHHRQPADLSRLLRRRTAGRRAASRRARPRPAGPRVPAPSDRHHPTESGSRPDRRTTHDSPRRPARHPAECPLDLDAAETAAAAFLQALGLSLEAEGLAASPARMARAYADLLTPGGSR